ncbi:hypothetical protein RA989_21120, partial [Mycobacteroides abscessus subsp. massiliense]
GLEGTAPHPHAQRESRRQDSPPAAGRRIHHQPIALAGDNSEIYAALLWSVLSITAAATIFRLVAQVLRRPRHSAAQRVIIGELIALGIATCLPGLTIFTLVPMPPAAPSTSTVSP